MVWLVMILAEDSHDMLLPVSAERAIFFVVQCEDWRQICLSLTRNRGTTWPTITAQCVCVNFFFLSLGSDASFPNQRETFEKL